MRQLFRVLLVALAAIPYAYGEETPAPSDDDCQSCHADASLTRADNTSLTVDKAKWGASIHSNVSVSCVDCHADLAKADFPHAEDLAPAVCTPCHEKELTGYQKGVHATLDRPGGKPAATCASCHGHAHEALASGDRKSKTHVLSVVATCSKCHADPKLIARAKLPEGVVADFDDSIHGRALTEAGLTVAPTCATCHGAHDVRRAADPDSPVFKLNQATTCGVCHVTMKEQYEGSIHAAKVARGEAKAPVCATCHSAHHIQRSDVAAWKLDVIAECGTCHAESLTTYRDTFHGRVTELGYERMAKCSDCHNAHAVVAKDDKRSTVSPQNIVATCQRCHESASKGFAGYDPHANPENRSRSALLYYSGKFMKLLLYGVFSIFWLHSALWLWRGLRDRGRRAKPEVLP